MSNHTHRAMTAELLSQQLDALLTELTGVYEQLAEASAAHRDALRRADGAGVARATEAQGLLVESLATLERRRRELVAHTCTRFAPLSSKRAVSITLLDLCECVPVGERAGLAARARALKGLVATVEEQTRTIKAATLSLVAHMEGLMRQVGHHLSHAGTYTRRGYVEAGGMVVSAVDLRS